MNHKSITTILFVFFFFLLVVSCENVDNKTETASNSKDPDKTQDINKKIDKINFNIEKLMLAGNYNDILPFYAEDVIICPSFHPTVKGKEAIKEIYEKNKNIGLKHHLFSGTTEDIWECEKFVYERGKFGMSFS